MIRIPAYINSQFYLSSSQDSRYPCQFLHPAHFTFQVLTKDWINVTDFRGWACSNTSNLRIKELRLTIHAPRQSYASIFKSSFLLVYFFPSWDRTTGIQEPKSIGPPGIKLSQGKFSSFTRLKPKILFKEKRRLTISTGSLWLLLVYLTLINVTGLVPRNFKCGAPIVFEISSHI